MPRGGSPVASHRPGVLELGGMWCPGGSRPYRHARKNLQVCVGLSMGEELWAPALAEQAHSRFSVAMHELRVPAPGAEGDQAALDIDVPDH
jgi:hypothetical protein